MEIAPQPKEVSPGVWLLTSPIQGYILSNAYLIEDEVLTLIDSGNPHADTNGLFDEQLRSIGYAPAEIKQIIYTHHHIDHTGGGSVLSQNCVMRHLVSSTVKSIFSDVDALNDPIRYLPKEIVRHYPKLESFVQPEKSGECFLLGLPHIVQKMKGEISGLKDGDTVDLGKRKLEVLFTPGHSLHDIMLLDRDNGLLFSGDYLLNWEANFYFVDGGDVDNYLQSLAKIKEISREIKQILPGHGEPIDTHIRKVITNSRESILKRCHLFVRYVKENGPKSAADVYMHFYGSQYQNVGWAGMLCTLITFLQYLVKSDQIKEVVGEPGVYY